jgi:predicted Mrr-cat superfamily restriction endonuclease
MWVIRGGEQNRLVDRFVDEGVVAVEFPEVPDAEILTHSEIRRFLAGDLSTAALDAEVGVMTAFVRELGEGNSILVPDPARGEVVVGTVTSRYEFHDDVPGELGKHRRTVDWIARHPISQLPSAVQGVTKQKLTLQQHRDAEWSGYLRQVRDGEIGRDPKDRPAGTTSTTTKASARSTTPRAPRVPKKPAPVTQKTCPGCFLQSHPDRFVGEYCADCAG